MDDRFVLDLPKFRDLRYGENPHQKAARYALGDEPFIQFVQGKELSYTNMLDLDAAFRLVHSFKEQPVAAIVKHANPCGVATAETLVEAYRIARDADSESAFGGIVGLNAMIDEATAIEIITTFIECVIARSISTEALAILATKPNMRVVLTDPLPPTEHREVLGEVLVQQVDRLEECDTLWPNEFTKVVTKRPPTAYEWEGLRFACRVCAKVKSNAVIFTANDQTLAIGAGQTSRLDAVLVARMKAERRSIDLKGSVSASDAFFPFRDGLDEVATAGATAVVQPGGSRNDQEVIDAANEHGMAMVFTGRRHFRH